MQKQHRLRWKRSDSETLERAINKYNRRVRTIEKKNPETKGLYPRMKYGWYRDAIKTRYDLNREIKALNKFSTPGMEELVNLSNNVKISKWQYEESLKRIETINAERKVRFNYVKRLPKKASGMKLGYTKAKFGFTNQKLKEFDPITLIGDNPQQRDIGMKWKALVKYSSTRYYTNSDYLWRDNYIKSLEENYGSEADDLIEKIKSMPINKFVKTAYSDSDADIKYNYANNYVDSIARLRQLYEVWDMDTSDFTEKFVEAEGLSDSDFM